MYCYVWEFVVRPDEVRAFEASYGPGGEWTQFFGRDPRYIRTVVLRDRNAPTRFVTIDYWTSGEAFLAFRDRFGAEFEDMDARFEPLALRETHMGEFELVE